jgi:hypothetical protein
MNYTLEIFFIVDEFRLKLYLVKKVIVNHQF